jgi:hypothetical protein
MHSAGVESDSAPITHDLSGAPITTDSSTITHDPARAPEPAGQIPPPPITSPFDSRPQRPTVGRIVHYYPGNVCETSKGQPYPAIITHVISDRVVNLRIFQDAQHPLPVSELTQAEVVSAEPGMAGRRWCWPPRG